MVEVTDLSEWESFDLFFFATSKTQARRKTNKYLNKVAKENNVSLSDVQIDKIEKLEYKPLPIMTQEMVDKHYKSDYREAQINEKYIKGE